MGSPPPFAAAAHVRARRHHRRQFQAPPSFAIAHALTVERHRKNPPRTGDRTAVATTTVPARPADTPRRHVPPPCPCARGGFDYGRAAPSPLWKPAATTVTTMITNHVLQPSLRCRRHRTRPSTPSPPPPTTSPPPRPPPGQSPPVVAFLPTRATAADSSTKTTPPPPSPPPRLRTAASSPARPPRVRLLDEGQRCLHRAPRRGAPSRAPNSPSCAALSLRARRLGPTRHR